ncbi:hypothetical protein [Flavilitoribacter nigricans]|uniref:Cellobiose phosphorylase n=1 Tax=Flavilitoribacter nigricans (strain ATCC 23147 / DSM 23189 / NBRC 102662 / NCIMB 1420 / SS-2) TaxID=1122177 RepID=A0A2D0N328_FLAN2|nr:hypothetical protein [Flavilitoribacter nigricans]PHN02921.1 hypothetical protein CRP01_29380 [Flavilitoribacter nigricans DSM 23189 = NBRC 102662]
MTVKSEISRVEIQGETYYKISNSDSMRPFFMSIVSDSDHWLFISSNGGMSAGRRNAEYALFPYYTDDKISESADLTGSKTIFRIHRKDQFEPWEPFSDRYVGRHRLSRNLYKNEYGNKIIFEEINHDLQLTFRYQWNSSDQFGFVKRSTLINHAQEAVKIELLDGIQNIMPYGVASELQMRSSNLVDAYKKSELEKESGLGIYALSAIIVDKAEPSEALKANVVWSSGFKDPTYLLSSRQLNDFRKGAKMQEEIDVRAEKGAYFIQTEITLSGQAEKDWMFIADVSKDHAYIADITTKIRQDAQLAQQVIQDIAAGTARLIRLVGAADGLQLSADKYRDTRHFSNTLFNIMRGGIFDHNYQIERADFLQYLTKANHAVFRASEKILADLPAVFTLFDLQHLAHNSEDDHFRRLSLEYMPLKFSRRHGDPSRPWNKFSINTRSEVDGSKILDYEGNWRDIFQNWEALAFSYPEFIESMIYKFLNATTFDGYNPYRVTKGGFDWETIEPDDPWSYIGYWGDHQIIYLLKFLEFLEKSAPAKLESYFGDAVFVYANVPYRIRPYEDILKDPKDTIEFDQQSDHEIRKKRAAIGADGALLETKDGSIYQVNFVEKMLAVLLAKLSNFIPEGGIWMNTQRPEWNDANNALVGNGVSMVTLYYLRRFLHFFKPLLAASKLDTVAISTELLTCFEAMAAALENSRHLLSGRINDQDRKTILDGLGQAASAYRLHIYRKAFSGRKEPLKLEDLRSFVDLSLQYLEHSIAANKRPDHLYHAYNLMTVVHPEEIAIGHLSEMLEGQVAVLSSGYLSSEEALEVLDALKASRLFREDQYSYLLYPNKDLPRFTEKNVIPGSSVDSSVLLRTLIENDHRGIISRDVNGKYHFNGDFKNAGDLKRSLEKLTQAEYVPLVAREKQQVLDIFEQVFDHKSFTGRSGTFFGYEGLGSIYWHMVSKLQLAVQECCLKAMAENADKAVKGQLIAHYYEINEGIGVHKSPALYGAFPTDPYSHTPAGKGAQQPGMTGQVKEDILSRFGELGVVVENGHLGFRPVLLRREEFLEAAGSFHYIDLQQEQKQLSLEPGSLCFTYCQIPVVYRLGQTNAMEIIHADGSTTNLEALSLDQATARQIFRRSGAFDRIVVSLKENELL